MSARRALTPYEQELIAKILEADDETSSLTAELPKLEAEVIDEYGSLAFYPSDWAKSTDVMRKLPTEGRALDTNGSTVHFLLFARGGQLCELQIYKDDGSRLVELPAVQDITIDVLR